MKLSAVRGGGELSGRRRLDRRRLGAGDADLVAGLELGLERPAADGQRYRLARLRPGLESDLCLSALPRLGRGTGLVGHRGDLGALRVRGEALGQRGVDVPRPQGDQADDRSHADCGDEELEQAMPRDPARPPARVPRGGHCRARLAALSAVRSSALRRSRPRRSPPERAGAPARVRAAG